MCIGIEFSEKAYTTQNRIPTKYIRYILKLMSETFLVLKTFIICGNIDPVVQKVATKPKTSIVVIFNYTTKNIIVGVV